MTVIRTGTVPTAHASRYLQQLAKHWSHKFAVDFDATRASIPLPLGLVTMTAGADALGVELAPAPDGEPERLRHVFEEHINRFAFREAPLPFTWTEREQA
ncbi:DUF2218 domain-containing protein [Sphingomonas bacterium]|uniref:DUF2218 domain-containing protein n=1 Tax=Sphingomonas bacterium TaxID=1895847 RepID=UPI001C2D51D9|nr:DUF2218 domain-containing protein [Sphingomonas bacterium]